MGGGSLPPHPGPDRPASSRWASLPLWCSWRKANCAHTAESSRWCTRPGVEGWGVREDVPATSLLSS